jgi:hypothetical protein
VSLRRGWVCLNISGDSSTLTATAHGFILLFDKVVTVALLIPFRWGALAKEPEQRAFMVVGNSTGWRWSRVLERSQYGK